MLTIDVVGDDVVVATLASPAQNTRVKCKEAEFTENKQQDLRFFYS